MDISNIKLVSSQDLDYHALWSEFLQDNMDDNHQAELLGRFFELHPEFAPNSEGLDKTDTFEDEVTELGYPKTSISCLAGIDTTANLGYILLPIPARGQEMEAFEAFKELLYQVDAERDKRSNEQTLKLRDFIKKDIDIDIADDVCEELAIAFVGPITLTEKGEENFSEILDLPVELHEGYATLPLNDNDHWEYLLKLAIEFFEAAAGYCEQDNYDAWFKS